jgi:signal transduction histidine kinase
MSTREEARMSVTTSSHAVVGTPLRPLRRGRENCILGGVCGGFATRLGIRERNIRIIFALLTLVFGLGILLYMTFWLVITRSGEEHSIIQQIFQNRREAQFVLVGFIGTLVLIIALQSTGSQTSDGFGWPLLLSVFAGFAVWRGASTDERNHLTEFFNSAPIIGGAFSKSRKGIVVRVIVGVALIIFGLDRLNHLGGVWGSAGSAIVGTLILVFGVLVLLAPWWLQNVRELTSERRERVRIEERATLAAHLHDSVLQTLTLIERAAANEGDVVRLARNQERELRQWLFSPETRTDAMTSFVGLIGAVEHDVENDYGVRVELVTVGDCVPDDRIITMVAAGREAAINAAKWSEASVVSIFTEIEPTSISIFVRDRGVGFDIDAIPADRQGIALSICQRMSRLGGEAFINTSVGSGTEVQLVMPRTL